MDMTIDYQKLGLRIRQMRQEHKLTQQKLAELADLSPNYVGKIERSASVISIETLVKLANALHTPVEYFLQDSLIEMTPNEYEEEILAMLRKMTVKEKAFALENMKLCKTFCQSLLDNLLV
jgi:transcriptional regulator with XRE-family HTH domain